MGCQFSNLVYEHYLPYWCSGYNNSLSLTVPTSPSLSLTQDVQELIIPKCLVATRWYLPHEAEECSHCLKYSLPWKSATSAPTRARWPCVPSSTLPLTPIPCSLSSLNLMTALGDIWSLPYHVTPSTATGPLNLCTSPNLSQILLLSQFLVSVWHRVNFLCSSRGTICILFPENGALMGRAWPEPWHSQRAHLLLVPCYASECLGPTYLHPNCKGSPFSPKVTYAKSIGNWTIYSLQGKCHSSLTLRYVVYPMTQEDNSQMLTL